MFTQMSRMLVMLVALLGVNIPPGRPPGRNPKTAGARPAGVPLAVPCPYTSCRGTGMWQTGYVFRCDECYKLSDYCTNCRSARRRGDQDPHACKP